MERVTDLAEPNTLEIFNNTDALLSLFWPCMGSEHLKSLFISMHYFRVSRSPEAQATWPGLAVHANTLVLEEVQAGVVDVVAAIIHHVAIPVAGLMEGAQQALSY